MQRGSQNYRGQGYRGNRGNYRGRYRGNNRGNRGRGYQGRGRPWQNNYGRNYNQSNQNYQNSNFNQNPNSQQQWSNPNQDNFQQGNSNQGSSQTTFEVFTPDPHYMPYTQQSTHTCYNCGYPNHLAKDCTAHGNPPQRGAQMPFNQNQKN